MSLWKGLPPPPKFPFWSAIITQQYGSVSVGAGASATVAIQPPAGETWWIYIDTFIYTHLTDQACRYDDFDGVVVHSHLRDIQDSAYTRRQVGLSVSKVLTNTLYGRLYYYNADTVSRSAYYGYSGFKLSKPLWSARRVHNPEAKPWKRGLTAELPSEISALTPYANEVWDFEKDDYVPVIMLEEDAVLAVDPITNFPIERLTAFVTSENLLNVLSRRDDPTLRPDIVLEVPIKYRNRRLRELTPLEFEEVTGYKKYLERWRSEGITL